VRSTTQRCRPSRSLLSTPRRYAGRKHHLIVDAQGIPLAVILTAANCNNITQLDALVKAIPPIRGKRGRPCANRKLFRATGATVPSRTDSACANGHRALACQNRSPHGSGLGKTRWVIEHSFAWLHAFRRLKIRYERYAHVHEAFLSLACCLICWNQLKTASD